MKWGAIWHSLECKKKPCILVYIKLSHKEFNFKTLWQAAKRKISWRWGSSNTFHARYTIVSLCLVVILHTMDTCGMCRGNFVVIQDTAISPLKFSRATCKWDFITSFGNKTTDCNTRHITLTTVASPHDTTDTYISNLNVQRLTMTTLRHNQAISRPCTVHHAMVGTVENHKAKG